MKRIHLDTDLGGETDDVCALAMLLGWPDVEITGITTSVDIKGIRAALVEYILKLAGRNDIPVASGAEGSLSGFMVPPVLSDLNKYWPEPITPKPASPGAALELLGNSIKTGATVLSIGPYTNLAILETTRPGILASAEVVLMGGCVTPVRSGLPNWGPEMDYNVQQDTLAAKIVFDRCNPILVELPVTLEVTLQASQIPRLRACGPLGDLIATQGELRAKEYDMPKLARGHDALPDDLLNFQYDPLACAVAVGWDGVKIEEFQLVANSKDGLLTFSIEPKGKLTRVVTAVESERFTQEWLDAVRRASKRL